MATTERQNRLLVAEDWRKIYQAFQQADFKSYDFETLRRTMVAYLKENYPDDFNDFVESSEYIELIDLIAYISQALSFRVDLNARENFLETAERTGARVAGPVPMPTTKRMFTVIRSPHVNKDSREYFELRTHKRLIDILEPSSKTIDSLTSLSVPSGVDIAIKL